MTELCPGDRGGRCICEDTDEWGALGVALDRLAAVVDALDEADREGFSGRPNWIRTDVIRNIGRPIHKEEGDR